MTCALAACAQNKTSEISKNALLEILGLLGAEQNVENLNKCTFRNSGTPVRSTERRKSQKCTFRNSGTPGRRTRRQKFWISKIRQTSSRWNCGFQTRSMFAICGCLHIFLLGCGCSNPVKLCHQLWSFRCCWGSQGLAK